MNWAGARLPSFSVNALGGGLPGSVLEGVFDLGPCLFGVALELIDAPLGAQAGIAGGAAEDLLGGALGPFELVGDLPTYAHCFLPMFVADSSFQGTQLATENSLYRLDSALIGVRRRRAVRSVVDRMNGDRRSTPSSSAVGSWPVPSPPLSRWPSPRAAVGNRGLGSQIPLRAGTFEVHGGRRVRGPRWGVARPTTA